MRSDAGEDKNQTAFGLQFSLIPACVEMREILRTEEEFSLTNFGHSSVDLKQPTPYYVGGMYSVWLAHEERQRSPYLHLGGLWWDLEAGALLRSSSSDIREGPSGREIDDFICSVPEDIANQWWW